MNFSDDFLSALGAWQNGWQEQQDRRSQLAEKLINAAQHLPESFRSISQPCFRKRFIHKGELVALILNNNRDEGLVSWTTDLQYAERFKGIFREDAVSGAIFRHQPTLVEVIVSVPSLWQSAEFVSAANSYRDKGGHFSDALFNFADRQGEVILNAPLRASEIIAFTGASSPFEQLCDQAGIKESSRDGIFRKLVAEGIYPGEYSFTSEDAAQRIIANTIRVMYERIAQAVASQNMK